MVRLKQVLYKIGDQSKSKFLFWPLVWVFAVPAIMIAGDASPLGLDLTWAVLYEPVLLFCGLVASLFASIVVIRSIRKKLWPNTLSASVLPILFLALACNPFGFIRGCNYVGNAVNLLVTQPQYLKGIKELPSDDQPRLLVFNRGGMLWSSEGFIYDEADEVALAPVQQSIRWKAKAESVAELSCGPYEAISLWGHFYYGGFSC